MASAFKSKQTSFNFGKEPASSGENTGAAMEFKPISQGLRNILNVHTVAIIELQQKFSSQNVFVLNRKVELYSMGWQDAMDLSRFIVSAAPFGGPIGKYIRLLLSVV